MSPTSVTLNLSLSFSQRTPMALLKIPYDQLMEGKREKTTEFVSQMSRCDMPMLPTK